MTDCAVYTRGAYKSYGFKWNPTSVLQNLDLNVPVGSIYGLLGASGCGKTTLLTCVVGQRRLDSGELLVLGNEPGRKGSGVPGRRVGYMPQDLGLLGEFTVRRSIYYFGWICNMADDDIEKQYRFLTGLLDLPRGGCSIKNLSGGQQRRVSLAATLVHSPELLVLDEPTVGLDPILRQSIWDYLTRLTLERKATVIITTHYIEEARQANVIGLMRQGRLLAEDSPQKLLLLYECPTLEQIFLKLSIQQSKCSDAIEATSQVPTFPAEANADTFSLEALSSRQLNHEAATKEGDEKDATTLETVKPKNPYSTESAVSPRLRKMKALLVKNYLQVVLSPAAMLIVTLLPLLQIVLLLYGIGGHPTGLRLAVSNQEIGNYSSCEEFQSHQFTGVGTGCHFSGLSCLFLSRINDSIAKKEYYTDKEASVATVRAGHAIAAIHFAANFSEELETRYKLGNAASRRTLEYSEIELHMDMSNTQLSVPMQAMLYDEYLGFASSLAISCGDNPKRARIPFQFNDPVYGFKYPRYIDYVTPKYIMFLVFFMATSLTSTLIITAKTDGIWDRNLVSGISVTEILVSHILCQTTFVLAICLECVFVATWIHDFRFKGAMALFMLLVILQGICGMFYGFAISILCTHFIYATFISVGSIVPFTLLGGVLWPIEGMGPELASLSKLLPFTLPNLSVSNIVSKGGGLMDPEVYLGFVMTLAWIIILCITCLVLIRIKK